MCACHNLLTSVLVDAQPIVGFAAFQEYYPSESWKLNKHQQTTVFRLLKSWLGATPSWLTPRFSRSARLCSQSTTSFSWQWVVLSWLTARCSQPGRLSSRLTTSFSWLWAESSQLSRLTSTSLSWLTARSRLATMYSRSARASSRLATVCSLWNPRHDHEQRCVEPQNRSGHGAGRGLITKIFLRRKNRIPDSVVFDTVPPGTYPLVSSSVGVQGVQQREHQRMVALCHASLPVNSSARGHRRNSVNVPDRPIQDLESTHSESEDAPAPGCAEPSPHAGNVIPELTSLVERVGSVCPVCGLLARKVCHGCGEKFCHAHVYVCVDCSTPLCGACMDDHLAEGHWSDSDTVREISGDYSGSRCGSTRRGGGR